ncbi:hypothetical protein, partial [Rhodococcus jostii]|uniref:hypothetical protein n=1 Tax=Rhodococcus jostii TaxID=132919 RepID=UPI003669C4F6
DSKAIGAAALAASGFDSKAIGAAALAASGFDSKAIGAAALAASGFDKSVLGKAILAQGDPSLVNASRQERIPSDDPAPIGDDVMDADEVEQDDER